MAIRTGTGWLLHAGDATFHGPEYEPPRPRLSLASRFFHRMLQADGPARHASLETLRRLRREHGEEIEIVCSHDARDLERLEPNDARSNVDSTPVEKENPA